MKFLEKEYGMIGLGRMEGGYEPRAAQKGPTKKIGAH